MIAADGKRDPNEQLKQVENFITQGVDAILIHVIDQTLAPRISKLCLDANIPLIYFNRKPDDSALTPGKVVAVASPEVVAGNLEGQFVADKLKGKGNVAILMGTMGSAPQIGRTQGTKDVLAKYPGIKIVREQTANFQRPDALTVVENWLASGVQIDAIVANNDEMAIGAVLVLEEKNMKDKVIVTGVDATSDALKFISDKRLDMTVLPERRSPGPRRGPDRDQADQQADRADLHRHSLRAGDLRQLQELHEIGSRGSGPPRGVPGRGGGSRKPGCDAGFRRLPAAPGNRAKAEACRDAGRTAKAGGSEGALGTVSEYILEMRGIQKSFPGVHALKGVDLSVRPGTVHGVMGENGAGKSTLMKVAIGLYRPDAGTIMLRGKPTVFVSVHDALSQGIAMIHQEMSPLPYMTVAQNIFLGREIRTRFGLINHRAIDAEAGRILKELNIDLQPRQIMGKLSVAQMQLVEIAEAVSRKADLIIMDEPTSALTEKEVAHLFAIIRNLKEKGTAVIFITHKLDEVFAMTDEVTVYRDGELVGHENSADLTREKLIKMMVGWTIEQFFLKEKANFG